MNSLSWIIYFIQIIDSFDTFLAWLTAFFFITGFFSFAIRILSDSDVRMTDWHSSLSKYWKIAVTCGFISAFMNVIVPDRTTMLLIAASQIGERVVNSQAAQNVIDPSLDLLKTWIEEQTHSLRQPEPPPRRGR